MNEPVSSLELLARLKALLSDLHRRGRVSLSEYQRGTSEVDRLLISAAEGLPQRSPKEILESLRAAGWLSDVSALEAHLVAAAVRDLRDAAFSEGRPFVDLSALYPGVDRIPLEPSDWSDVADRWARLSDEMKGGKGFEELLREAQEFFDARTSVHLPAHLPRPHGDLMSSLLAERLISNDEAGELAADWNGAEEALHLQEDRVQKRILEGDVSGLGEDSGALARSLKRILSRGAYALSPSVEAWIAQWPELTASLVSSFWSAAKREASARRRVAPLLLARTGVDPLDEGEWLAWVRRETDREEARRAPSLAGIRSESLQYDLAFVLSALPFLEKGRMRLWRAVLLRLRAPAEEPAPQVRKGLVPTTDLPASLVPSEGAEELEAVPEVLSAEDALVERRSTWNLYLKPFLSENWLGVIGVASLMAAWIFLSLWLWDKGETFRLLMGSAPLLALTLGAAYTTTLVGRRDDVSPRVVSLFAVITFLLVPFNFAIGISVLDVESRWTLPLGLALAAIFALALRWVGRWLAPALGDTPTVYLYSIQFLLYVAPASRWILGASTVRPALQSMALAGFFATVYSVDRLTKLDSTSFRFWCALYAAVYVLSNAIARVYYRVPLESSTAAVLLEGTALALAYFGKTRATSSVAAGALSFLGILLGLNAPAWLPLLLGLATALWIYQRRRIEARWPAEVLVLHVFALVLCPIYVFGLPFSNWHYLLFVALVAGALFEGRTASTRTMDYAVVASPVVSFLVSKGSGHAPAVFLPVLLLGVSVFAYRRFSRARSTALWFLNLALAALWWSPAAWLAPYPAPAELALHGSVVSLIWAVVSIRLDDSLARAHRTLVLWALAFISTGLAAFALARAGSTWDVRVLAAAPLTVGALVLAARRAQSSLPLYVALGLAAATGVWIKTVLGIQSRAGLVEAMAALLALGLGAFFEAQKTWQDDSRAEALLGGSFPLRERRFLPRSFEVAGFIAALVSSGKALLAFAPVTEAPGASLALALDTVSLARVATLFSWEGLAYFHFVPLFAVFGTLLASLPTAFVPHGALLLLALLLVVGRSERIPSPQLVTAWNRVTEALLKVSTIAAFSGYLAFGASAPWVGLVYALLAIVFFEWFVVRRDARFHQVVIGHFVAFWTVALLKGLAAKFPLQYLAGLGAALFVAYLWETSPRPQLVVYSRGAQPWLLACGVLYAGSAVVPLFTGAPMAHPVLYTSAGWVLLHIGNRHWQRLEVLFLKAALALRLGHAIAGDVLVGLFLGTLLFYLLEWMVDDLDRRSPLRLRATPFGATPDVRQGALALLACVVFVLAAHVFISIDSGIGGGVVTHSVLYGLIPFAFLLYRDLKYKLLAYAPPALFAYANLFEVARLDPFTRAQQISLLHLLSLGCLGSVVAFAVLTRFYRERRRG